jgi:hypothetical protein
LTFEKDSVCNTPAPGSEFSFSVSLNFAETTYLRDLNLVIPEEIKVKIFLQVTILRPTHPSYSQIYLMDEGSGTTAF